MHLTPATLTESTPRPDRRQVALLLLQPSQCCLPRPLICTCPLPENRSPPSDWPQQAVRPTAACIRSRCLSPSPRLPDSGIPDGPTSLIVARRLATGSPRHLQRPGLHPHGCGFGARSAVQIKHSPAQFSWRWSALTWIYLVAACSSTHPLCRSPPMHSRWHCTRCCFAAVCDRLTLCT